jgi:hypothetical protein
MKLILSITLDKVNTSLPLSNVDFSWFFNKFVIFLTVSSIIVVMILNSNFQMGLIRESLLSASSKLIIFSLYVLTFTLAGLILLKSTNLSIQGIKGGGRRIYSISMFVIYFILSFTLIFTITQIFISNSYSNLVFYVTAYLSFTSSMVFLIVLSFKFFQLYSQKTNYLTLSYGILFALFCMSILLILIYLTDGLAVLPSEIEPSSPRLLIVGEYSINVKFQNNIAKAYDIFFFISFILAWILSVMILKQYIHRIGKYKFWLLVSLPLFFHLTRYVSILNLDQGYIESSTNTIPSTVGQSIFTSLINSDMQIGGIFFGISFLIIALKLKSSQLKRIVIIVVIGIMLLFGSRDFQSIFIPSIPPGGVVTISFMAIASYMLLSSLTSFVKLASRDKQLQADLTHRVENDSILVKNLISSEKKIQTLGVLRPLIDYSVQWQKSHSYEELSMAEVKDIIDDVRSELKERNLKR